jgi:ABC-2 type transport system permease protein/sodium transport system permease protein
VLGRLARLTLKELREILRDRRTIVTLVVMPLLLYPLLALVFQRFLITSLTVDGTDVYVVGVDSERSGRLLNRQLQTGDAILREQVADRVAESSASPDEQSLAEAAARFGVQWAKDDVHVQPEIQWLLLPPATQRRHVLDATVHLAVTSQRDAGDPGEQGLGEPLTWDLYYRPGSPSSEAALRFVETRLQALNETHLDLQLKKLGIAAELLAGVTRHAVAFGGTPTFSLAALIPLILVMMTVTGAVYPAIDLTAGERERGTLETLIAAPVPRLGLLLAKYVAVLTVALLTATVNLLAMAITSHSTGLNASLFGGAGMTLAMVVKVLLLLGLFAAFFSAVLLAVTSMARSFKEAQAYIIPLMLLCLVPGIVCLTPSLKFTGLLAVIPLVNIVVLARDLLEGGVHSALAAAAVLSTMLYVLAAIALAARVFGSDAILYGGQATWSDFFRRPAEPRSTARPTTIMFILAAIFPCYFLLGNELARSVGLSIERRVIVSALVTAVVFGVIPWSVARFHRVSVRTGVGLGVSSAGALLAAALLGVSAWPAAHELFLFGEWLGVWTLRADQVALVENLVDEWQAVPWMLIVVTLAIVPAVFEECFFRGWLFTSLRSIMRPMGTIIAAAVMFGLFHVVAAQVLAVERFLPSTFLGLVLGWVRYRAGSVWPCILLHAVHNGLLLSISYWQDALQQRGIGVEEAAHLPATWLLVAGGVAAVGVALLVMSTRVPRSREA